MIIQVIKFKSALSEDEVIQTAEERADSFRALPGLVQKYYTRTDQPDHFAGIYIWDSMESLQQYRESELAATIPQAYKVVGMPDVQIYDVLFPLRE